MKIELEKYGIQMPAFSKIGGILANELSVDEAARKGAKLGRGGRRGRFQGGAGGRSPAAERGPCLSCKHCSRLLCSCDLGMSGWF